MPFTCRYMVTVIKTCLMLDPELRLTCNVYVIIIIFTVTLRIRPLYGQETHPRSQGSRPSPTGLFEFSPRASHRRTVLDQRFLRCPRSRPGQIRDAAPGRERGPADKPGGGGLRVLAALLLPGAGYFPAGRPAGADATQARPQGSSQAHRRCARLCASDASGRFFLAFGRFGGQCQGEIRHLRSSTKYRARPGAESKKTAVKKNFPTATRRQ